MFNMMMFNVITMYDYTIQAVAALIINEFIKLQPVPPQSHTGPVAPATPRRVGLRLRQPLSGGPVH